MSTGGTPRTTRVLSIRDINPPHVPCESDLVDWFEREKESGSLPLRQVGHLLEAAHLLRTSSIPVAFPTETVYGLGADATRSEAVRAIFTTKGRPADNPLIVHVGTLAQLKGLLRGRSHMTATTTTTTTMTNNSDHVPDETDPGPIPSVYKPLIARFWPGPLTLLFPLLTTDTDPSHPSPFAPETHPNLQSVGIRMPSSPLARLLIYLADRPLAAPSANASTRPSPTSAAHVFEDLEGRIDVILDGGPCSVGVESTVVDAFPVDGGPPAILRPGGVGLEEIRAVGGVWSRVRVGYGPDKERRSGLGGSDLVEDEGSSKRNDEQEGDGDNVHHKDQKVDDVTDGPRAPGMKYRHYAPRARVVLFEQQGQDDSEDALHHATAASEQIARNKLLELYATKHGNRAKEGSKAGPAKVGVIATRRWRPDLGTGLPVIIISGKDQHPQNRLASSPPSQPQPQPQAASASTSTSASASSTTTPSKSDTGDTTSLNLYLHTISLGPSVASVARGLFGALRDLDAAECEVILVEGIGMGTAGEDRSRREGVEAEEWHLAAAVMDRVRKAACG